MPKTRRDRSVSYESSRKSPVPSASSHDRHKTLKFSENKEDLKEWEEARCPVCMEHPHNSVLLICSSYEKGCHPYMCDTSYRHSNCLDQFQKSFAESSSDAAEQEMILGSAQSFSPFEVGPTDAIVGSQERRNTDHSATSIFSGMHKLQHKLVCPLCRGQISGWIVEESARLFMNDKSRSCARETCEFNGNYSDLRKHAREDHPLVRPSQADPERQRNWRRLERQRDIGDVLSTIRSSFGDDVIHGDDDGVLPIEDSGWLTVFFLIRVFRPTASSRSSSWSGASRARSYVGVRRRSSRLWGESYDTDASTHPRDDDNEHSDGGSVTWRRRLRRRTTPDDQS
ncbi:hypothetical protein Droror1_Dr00007742 [Drosera rotundifolia]